MPQAFRAILCKMPHIGQLSKDTDWRIPPFPHSQLETVGQCEQIPSWLCKCAVSGTNEKARACQAFRACCHSEPLKLVLSNFLAGSHMKFRTSPGSGYDIVRSIDGWFAVQPRLSATKNKDITQFDALQLADCGLSMRTCVTFSFKSGCLRSPLCTREVSTWCSVSYSRQHLKFSSGGKAWRQR